MDSTPRIDWDSVVEDLGPALLRYFLASGFARAHASDAVQETLLRLVRLAREGEYDPKRGSPRMLAFGIARLVKHEFYRNVSEHELHADTKEYAERPTADELSEGVARPAAQSSLEDHETRSRLRGAIRSLDYPVREIFLLMIDEELRLEEISGILTIPVGTIKSHIHRGKEKLREILIQEKVSR
jgi:RNA polymerase sigma-70 factor (ECF subfamily)